MHARLTRCSVRKAPRILNENDLGLLSGGRGMNQSMRIDENHTFNSLRECSEGSWFGLSSGVSISSSRECYLM